VGRKLDKGRAADHGQRKGTNKERKRKEKGKKIKRHMRGKDRRR